MTYNSYLYGEGKDHILTMQWRKEYNTPTVSTTIVSAKTCDTKTKVSWKRATDDDTPAEKLYYTIMWKKANELIWAWDVGYDMTEYTIEELTPNTKYDCKVSVADYSGNKYDYPPIQFTTRATEEYIKLGEIPVTSNNYLDITAENGFTALKSGSVSYNPDTKTLYLSDANIDNGTNYAIRNSNNALNIYVFGTNNVSGILSSQALAITGWTANATLNSQQPDDCGIYAKGATLTVSDCKGTISGKWGIAGNTGHYPDVTIDNSRLKISSTDGTIIDINSLTLTGCKIVSPVNVTFNKDKHALCGIVFKDIVTGDVEIATTTAVESIETDADTTPTAVFSADGQRRATMQKGMNIVRMSDGTTRKVMVK